MILLADRDGHRHKDLQTNNDAASDAHNQLQVLQALWAVRSTSDVRFTGLILTLLNQVCENGSSHFSPFSCCCNKRTSQ